MILLAISYEPVHNEFTVANCQGDALVEGQTYDSKRLKQCEEFVSGHNLLSLSARTFTCT